MNKTIPEKILLNQAVVVDSSMPYKLASGVNSPVYCDIRKLLSDVATRNEIIEKLSTKIQKEKFENYVLVGVATAGIPWASLLSQRLNMPLAYVRPEPKDHGLGKQIEGKINKGQKAIVIEDLTSTGGSAIRSVEAIKAENIEVLCCYSICSYRSKLATEKFINLDIKHSFLFGIDEILETAFNTKYLNKAEIDIVQTWLRTGPFLSDI
jgi:orotate phosphoribosyltransferase